MRSTLSALVGALLLVCLSVSAGEAVITLKHEILLKESDTDSNYQFYGPNNFVMDDDLNLYVLEGRGNVLKKFDRNGKYLRTIGSHGTGPGEFYSPSRLQILDGKIFVKDDAGNLNIFDLNGVFIKAKEFPWGVPSRRIRFISSDKFFGSGTEDNTHRFMLGLFSLEDERALETITSEDASRWVIRFSHGKEDVEAKINLSDHYFDLLSDGHVVYAVQYDPNVYEYGKGKSKALFKLSGTPFKKQGRDLEIARRLHEQLKVPLREFEPIVKKIIVDERDDIWVLIDTKERQGWLRYGRNGKLKRFYKEPCEDCRKARTIVIKAGYIHYMVYDDEKGLTILRAKIQD